MTCSELKKWPRGRAWPILLSAIVFLFLAGLYWSWRPVGMEDADTSIYLSGAKSFAEGKGYRFVAHANEPKITMVPPLQSLFLASWWKLGTSFPENMDMLYAGMILLTLFSFFLVLKYWRKEGVPLWSALPGILIWGVALSWVFLIYWFLSDVLFGIFWVLLALHWRAATALSTPRWWAVAGLLMVGMFLTRTAALAPIAALGLIAVCRRSETRLRNVVSFGLPVALVMFCWWRWTSANQNYGSLIGFFQQYEGGFLGLVKLCLTNLTGYLSGNTFILGLAPAFFEQMTSPGRFDSTTGIALVLFFQAAGMFWMFLWLYGVFKLGSAREKWLAFVVLAYLIQVGLWPYDFSTRGGYAVVPILVPWAWRGGAHFARKFRITSPVRIAVLSSACFIFSTNLQILQEKIDTWHRLCRFDELREVAAWVRENTPTNSLVASTWTLPNLYFSEYSGRQIVTDYTRKNLTWEPVSHAAQGFATADYVLTSFKWDLDVPESEKEKYSLVKMSSQRFYRLHRVQRPQLTASVEQDTLVSPGAHTPREMQTP